MKNWELFFNKQEKLPKNHLKTEQIYGKTDFNEIEFDFMLPYTLYIKILYGIVYIQIMVNYLSFQWFFYVLLQIFEPI